MQLTSAGGAQRNTTYLTDDRVKRAKRRQELLEVRDTLRYYAVQRVRSPSGHLSIKEQQSWQ